MIDVPIIFVVGAPGCGKSTQCANIVEKYGFTHLESTELISNEIQSGSARGFKLLASIENGEYVTANEVLCLLEKKMLLKNGSTNGFLIEGYPRLRRHAKAFERRLGEIDLVIDINCTDENLVQRIVERIRNNDPSIRNICNESYFVARVQNIKKKIRNIVRCYPTKTLTINGDCSIEAVAQDFEKCIRCIVKKRTIEINC